MTKLAPEWVRTSDPVIRSPARYRWTTVPAAQFILEVCLLIRPLLFNRLSSRSDTLQNDSWVPKDFWKSRPKFLFCEI